MLIGTAVYRLYDSNGTLLYVGIAECPHARFRQHAKDKDWWTRVADYKLSWHSWAADAEVEEQIAIAEEGPLLNKTLPPWRIGSTDEANRRHREPMEQAQAMVLRSLDEGADLVSLARKVGWSPVFVEKLAAKKRSQRMQAMVEATPHAPAA